MIVVFIALVALACPIVLRAVNNNPFKYSQSDKKEKKKEAIKENPIETLTTDVKNTEKKELENKVKETKQKDLQEEYSKYLEKIPFGDFIELRTEDEGKVSISLSKAKKLPETDDRVKTVKSEISDVGQLVEFEYDVYVSEGIFSFNGSIFQYFDNNNEQGAIIQDELESGAELEKGERKTAKVLVAFKGTGESVSVTIGNANFTGNIE